MIQLRATRWIAGSAFLLLIAASAGGLEFSEVLSRVDQTSEVSTAAIALDLARAELDLSEHAGSISVGFQPGVTVSTPDGGPFADEVRFTGNLSLSAPVGLSDASEASLPGRVANVAAAERALERAFDDARYQIYLLYQNAWLAQREQEVLVAELETAREIVQNNQRLFESGLISLAVLSASEEKVADAEIAYLENSRDRRITWLELAHTVGMDFSTTPVLQAPMVDFGTLPQPPELANTAMRTDPAILTQIERIASLEAQIEEPPSRNPLETVRATLSAFSHNAALTYNPGASSLTGTYSFPIATIGGSDSTTGSGSTQTWDIGLSVSLGVQTQREHSLELEITSLELEQARERLVLLENVIELQVRTRYQQYLLSKGAAEQAELGYQKAVSNLELVTERYRQDRVTRVDVLEAETQVVRAEAQLNTARAREIQAALAAAAYAGYLPEIWQ